jgi:hypothetical protein
MRFAKGSGNGQLDHTVVAKVYETVLGRELRAAGPSTNRS